MNRNRWATTVDVSAPWRNESLSLADKVAAIVAAFSARISEDSAFLVGPFAYDDLTDMLADLTEAGEQDDVDAFDEVWSNIYDWADDQRVWIETRGRVR